MNDRAARRREQNRIAQQNHRKWTYDGTILQSIDRSLSLLGRRKQLAQPDNREQRQRPRQEPQQLWQQGWAGNEDDEAVALQVAPERQPWGDDSTTAHPVQQSDGVSDPPVETPELGYFNVFDSLIQQPNPFNKQHEMLDTSASIQDELPQGVSGGTSGNTDLPPVLVSSERHMQETAIQGLGSPKRRMPSSRMSSTTSPSVRTPTGSLTTTSFGSYMQSVGTELSSHSSLRSSARLSAKNNNLGKISSPTQMAEANAEPPDRPPRKGQVRPISFHMCAPRRSFESGVHSQDPVNAGSHGQTCLHLAAAKGSSGLIKYLLEGGMSPDTTDSNGFTALHYAIGGGHEETVSLLLRKGADVEVTDNGGRTALHFAIEEKQDDIAVLLINEGADMHATVSRPVRRFSK
jgi:hypothetical protein